MLTLTHISKQYTTDDGQVDALADISLTLPAGQLLTITGPSGSGKSTLLVITGGLLAPTTGTVSIAGLDVTAMSIRERTRFRGASIGFVFQRFHLVPYLTVRENILATTLNRLPKRHRQSVDELLDRFGLTDRANHRPDALSTGERQRTALARAMLPNPPLLLADEPTGNLDDANAEIVKRTLEAYVEAGGAVLAVTHDARLKSPHHPHLQLEKGRLRVP